jgi:beta-lactamase regulating signal transducer with metallopeptidase domain
VGLLRPWIVFSPRLAKALEDRAIEAALEHERAHARHWDPLRIWLAQLATDLQWPWPQARDRFAQWMLALELARDEEARAAGVDGSDLASAVLASARFRHNVTPFSSAALTGEPRAIKERIARLLAALPDDSETRTGRHVLLSALATSLLLSVALGSIFGDRIVSALLRVAA